MLKKSMVVMRIIVDVKKNTVKVFKRTEIC